MDILNFEIKDTLMVEIVTTSILTILILFMSLTLIHLVFQNKKNKGKKRITFMILAMITLVTTMSWISSMSRVYEYERVTAKVTDWDKVYDNNWEVLSIDEESNIAELKRKIKSDKN